MKLYFNLGKKKLLLLFLIPILFLIPFSSANFGYNNPNLPQVIPQSTTTTTSSGGSGTANVSVPFKYNSTSIWNDTAVLGIGREGVLSGYRADINTGTGAGLHVQMGSIGNANNALLIDDFFGTVLMSVTGAGVVTFNSLDLPNNNNAVNTIGGFVTYGDTQTTMQSFGTSNRRVLTLLNDDTTVLPALQFARYMSSPTWQYLNVAHISTNWTNSVEATREGELSMSVSDYNSDRTFMRANANGTNVKVTYDVDNILINGNLNVSGCIIYNSTGVPVTLGTCI